MKPYVRTFLSVILALTILSTNCCAIEGNLIFYKQLCIFQRFIKQLESFKPKTISLSSNDREERVKADYSERVAYIEKNHKKWEKLILSFKRDYNKFKDSDISNDLLFCISSAYIMLSQLSYDYYNSAIAETNALLEKPGIIYLKPTTIKILSNTNTFNWLGQKDATQRIKPKMAKSLIFLNLKYGNLEVAKRETEVMKDNKIFDVNEYLEVINYIESYEKMKKK